MIRKRIHFTSSPNTPLEYPCKARRHGRRSTSTSGGNVMTQREDILAEILAKLPVKSLMRFRCVSKPWRSLIDKRHFEKMRQAQRGLADNDLRIMFRINPFTSVGLDDLIDKETHLPVPTRRHTFPVSNLDMKNIGSSNGLICIEIKFERSKYMYLLWNPCTGGYKQLPISDIDCISRYFGFGYDSMADDYKIVKGSHFEFNEIATDVLTPIVQVFSLKNSRWETNTCAKGILLIGQGVLLNGFLHWIVYEDRKRSDKQIVIRRFSLSEERFIEDLYAPWFENGGFMAWGKTLCLYSTEGCNDLNIWTMNAYGVKESWTRILGVAVISFRDNWNADYVPICFLPDGNLLLFKRDAIGGRLILYKIGDNKFTDVVVPDVSYLTCHSQVCIYRETLVSPTNI